MIQRAAGLVLGLVAFATPGRSEMLAVVSQGSSTVAEIDASRGVIARSFGVGRSPAGIAVAQGAGPIYVAYPDSRSIGVFDAGSGKIIRTLPFEGQPFGIATDGDNVYVSDWSAERVVKLDSITGTVIASASVGKSPAGIVLDRVVQRLYVADRESDDIAVIDAKAFRRIATIAVGKAPYAPALSPDGGRLYVADVRGNDISVIDTHRLARIATVAVGSMPYGVAVTPDGTRVLSTNQHAGTLSVIDAKTLAVVATIGVGRYPEGVICDARGRAYVANWFSDDVSVIDLGGHREVARIKVGDGPRSFAVLARDK